MLYFLCSCQSVSLCCSVQEISKLETLDVSQRMAMQQALTNRVALVQGPPGTGKTFMGVQMCDIILSCSSEKILIVCQTNHALDQVMEALQDQGITQLVRIGGRSVSQRLEPYNVKNLMSPYSASAGWRMSCLKGELKDLQDTVASMQRKIAAVNSYKQALITSKLQPQQGLQKAKFGKPKKPSKRPPAQQQQYRKSWQQPTLANPSTPPEAGSDPWLWRALRLFLESEHPAESRQLIVAKSTSNSRFQQWLTGGKDNHLDSTLLRAVSPFLQRPSSNTVPIASSNTVDGSTSEAVSAPVTSSTLSPTAPQNTLWVLSKQDRVALLQKWLEEVVEVESESVSHSLQRADQLCLEIKSVNEGPWEQVLADARVIGCTTSGAAKYKDVIEQARVGPALHLHFHPQDQNTLQLAFRLVQVVDLKLSTTTWNSRSKIGFTSCSRMLLLSNV